jgi:RND family efflux transporter MFP subunit
MTLIPALTKAWRQLPLSLLLLLATLFTGLPGAAAASSQTYTITDLPIIDRKAVFATVESSKTIAARARIGGTVGKLKVDEGSYVKKGEVIAVVTDEKLVLKLKALDASLRGLMAQQAQARIDLDRAITLHARGTIPKSRLETARTAFDVASNQLKSAKAERSVTAEQLDEGEVLAPTSGRVLSVPVTNGVVILPGESIAQIATQNYILRLELPERHARFIAKGDKVLLGERGLSPNGAVVGEGTITQVYPKLNQGRVIADVTARGLGNYFVGERVRVLVSAGKRNTFAIPASFAFKRYGLDYVKLARKGAEPIEIVVQLGLPLRGKAQNKLVEVLAGLNAGDILVKP